MGTNPWTFIAIAVFGGAAGIIALSALISLTMSFFSGRTVNKTVDHFLLKLEGKLPGRNCGECGCENCRVYAEALLNRDMDFDKCPYGNQSLPEELEGIVDDFWKIANDRAPVEKRRFWQRKDDIGK
ncbi:MAG: hypothetical protein IJO45_06380 [Oscillospiraceae bacterium]|nr:hypothetical protein [Oscillospiraceae bacterium]